MIYRTHAFKPGMLITSLSTDGYLAGIIIEIEDIAENYLRIFWLDNEQIAGHTMDFIQLHYEPYV